MTAKKTAKKTETFEQQTEKATDFAQANLDAFVKAAEAATKATETLNAEIAAYSKKSFEDMTAVAEDLASVKTPVDLVEKQTEFAKSALEGFMAQATKMTELYTAAAKDINAPLNERMSAFKSFAA